MSTLGRTTEDVQKIPHTNHCENMHSNQIFIRHLFKITLIYYSYVVLYGIRGGGQVLKLWNMRCLVPWWCRFIYLEIF